MALRRPGISARRVSDQRCREEARLPPLLAILEAGQCCASATRWGLRSLAVFLIAWGVGCRSSDSSAVAEPQAAPLEVTTKPTRAKTVELSRDLLDRIWSCEVRHRGLLIDPASEFAQASRGFVFGPQSLVHSAERAGTRTAKVLTNKVEYDFWLESAAEDLMISVRMHAGTARSVIAFLDGRRLGASQLPKKGAKTVRFGPSSASVGPGRHVLTLRFAGPRRLPEPLAMLDWIRVHLAAAADDQYAAPTADNLLEDIVLGDVPRRALALRAPGSVRCGLMPVAGLRLKLDVGYWGTGGGVFQIRVRSASGNTVVLSEQRVEGGEDGHWTPLDLSLDAFADELIAVEFAAVQTGGAGRVVFGEPRLVRQQSALTDSQVRHVVVVMLGGLSRQLLPPWGNREGLGMFFELAQESVTFDGYRASSTLVTSVMATLLSGAKPAQHQVLDPSTRIPDELTLVSEAFRRRLGASAFFTNVPYSFAAFGFGRGWGTFRTFSPVEDRPAAEPLLLGADWLQAELERDPEQPKLLVVHLTGAHPPWDVSADVLKHLPPQDYEGPLDPRRAALQLRQLRNQRRGRLSSADWERLEAMQHESLKKVDVALSRLVRTLREVGQWDETLLVLMGDVAMGDRPGVPFVPAGDLEEGRLAAPLLVKFPGNLDLPKRVGVRVSTESVGKTLYESLAIDMDVPVSAPSLNTLARAGTLLDANPVLARLGSQYSFYLGRYRLKGNFGEAPSLCDIEVDPACQLDLFERHPFLVQWMWRRALVQLHQGSDGPSWERRPAEIDDPTRAALIVYGL